MKNIRKIVFAFLCLGLVMGATTSCDEDVVESTKQFIPLFVLNGDAIVTLEVGDTWVDPGASATEGPLELDVTVSGSVDLNTPGVYQVSYSATGTAGESFAATRLVIVTLASGDVSGNSLAGTWSPIGGPAVCGITSEMVEIGPGTYLFNWYGDNPGQCYSQQGLNSAISARFFSTDGLVLVAPLQPIPANIFGIGTSEGGGLYDPNTNVLNISMPNPGLSRQWSKN